MQGTFFPLLNREPCLYGKISKRSCSGNDVKIYSNRTSSFGMICKLVFLAAYMVASICTPEQ